MLALHLLSEGGEGPNTELQIWLYIGLALFLLVILVGWWVESKKQNQAEVKHEAVKPKKSEPEQSESKGKRKKSSH